MFNGRSVDTEAGITQLILEPGHMFGIFGMVSCLSQSEKKATLYRESAPDD